MNCVILQWLLLVLTLVNLSQSRRVKVQPRLQPLEDESNVQYYAAEPQDEPDNRQRVVLGKYCWFDQLTQY